RAGEENAADARVAVVHQVEQLQPAHVRHVLVADEEANRLRAQELEGLGAAAGGVHDVAGVLEQALQREAHCGLVVDDQHGARRAQASSSWRLPNGTPALFAWRRKFARSMPAASAAAVTLPPLFSSMVER